MLLKKLQIKQSLFVKVLSSVLLVLLVIVLSMELYNMYILRLYRSRAEETYRSSLASYGRFWDAKLEVINNSLITVASGQYDNTFRDLCYGLDTLRLETGKVVMLRKLEEIAQMHNQQIYTFAYIPKRNIYISGSRRFTALVGMQELAREIRSASRKYTDQERQWQMLHVEGRYYLMKMFLAEEGFLGAVIPCDTILESLFEDDTVIGATAFLREDGTPIYQLNPQTPFQMSSTSFVQNMDMLEYKIGVTISQETFYSDTTLSVLSMMGILLMGIIFVVSNMQLQKRIVLQPLNTLKDAMVRFSAGALDVRLKEKTTTKEIETLYRTFNTMAEQTVHLKIDVYESELEKQEIQYRFLQIQIQPHFYTNILNLIYRLAEMGYDDSIKKLSLATARYFRYLLSNKGDLISLDREIRCVLDYVEIQSIRYPQLLDFRIDRPPSAQEIPVPPLVLQTFVENSIMHNITLVPLLKVRVAVFEGPQGLILEITDNGLGFDRALLERIHKGENISEDGRHIGMVNVRQRLKILYGERASVRVIQKKDRTTIRVALPKGREKPDEAFTGGR